MSDEDLLPHDRAVWRPYDAEKLQGSPPPGTATRPVSIERFNGLKVVAYGAGADWSDCKNWRFGWPPRDG